MKPLIVIPARMDSTRLPGKPLLKVGGRTLLEMAVETALKVPGASVFVASPDIDVLMAVPDGAVGVPSSPHCTCGMERCFEVWWHPYNRGRSDDQVVVNYQVDELHVTPEEICRVIELAATFNAGTLAGSMTETECRSPNVVKVIVADPNDAALYFSRCPLVGSHRHIGVYALKARLLSFYSSHKRGRLEQVEDLEQVRLMEHGHRWFVVRTDRFGCSVNTQDDLDRLQSNGCDAMPPCEP